MDVVIQRVRLGVDGRHNEADGAIVTDVRPRLYANGQGDALGVCVTACLPGHPVFAGAYTEVHHEIVWGDERRDADVEQAIARAKVFLESGGRR